MKGKVMNMQRQVTFSIVVPVYNEAEVLQSTYDRLKTVMDSTGDPYELIFVNDGSSDDSIHMLKSLAQSDPAVKCINFSRNFGHQIAITAGTDYAAGEAIVVIDADLQDPPELILEMAEKWRQGFDVVYAVRTKREGETFFKKQTAAMFYRILRKLTDVDIPVDTGDFRLMDRKVVNEMNKLKEKNPRPRPCQLARVQADRRLLRAPRTACRGNEVPSQKNAEALARRHHFIFLSAAETGKLLRNRAVSGRFYICLHRRLHEAVYDKHHYRVVFDDHSAMLVQRLYPDHPRSDRRIHRPHL